MSPAMAVSFKQKKHSARKTMVSVTQSGGCPWEQCLELGYWADSLLDTSFLLGRIHSQKESTGDHVITKTIFSKRPSGSCRSHSRQSDQPYGRIPQPSGCAQSPPTRLDTQVAPYLPVQSASGRCLNKYREPMRI